MKFNILTLSLALSACAASSPVFAADAPPETPLASPAAASNPWEGFYVGGHVGYAFGTSSYQSNPPAWPAAGSVGLYGEDGQFGPLYGGLQAGYNHVTPSGLMFGLEADFSFPDKMNSNLPLIYSPVGPSVVNDKIEIFGSVRGRIGYAFGNWLIYGAGGFAYDRDLATSTDTAGDVDSAYFWRPGGRRAPASKSGFRPTGARSSNIPIWISATPTPSFQSPASATIPILRCRRPSSA